MKKYTIKLEKLIFFGFHGVNQDEIKNGKNFVLDIKLDYSIDNISDKIENTIDYIKIYNLLNNSFNQKRFNLLESLGSYLINEITRNFKQIFYIKLNIRKPQIKIDNNKDFINIELEYNKWTFF